MTAPNGIFIDPTKWKDNWTGATPPVQWQAVSADNRFWFNDAQGLFPGQVSTLIYISDFSAIANETVELDWQIITSEVGNTGGYQVAYRFAGTDSFTVISIGHLISSGTVPIAIPANVTYFEWGLRAIESGSMYGGVVAVGGAELCFNDSFNCDCETTSTFMTLAQLRTRMMIQIGYAAQAANPPPGMVAYLNEYLYSSQKQLYDKYKALHTERLYHWIMEPGVRYYGLSDNQGCCGAKLDPKKITWVGFEDLNQAWYQLVCGINPLWYTRANIQTGWPTRYEIRSCIEVFPAPQAAYTLWIKGHLGLMPFIADADQPTIDDELVLLYAVANAKSDKGKPDAARAMNQATARLKDLTAANHVLRRYVPGTTTDSPATPPRFLPLNGAPP